MRERRHGQMKNEIMNGNQGDHVTLCDHGVEASKDWVLSHISSIFQHHDADAVHRRTLRSPDVTLLTQAGWYGLSGFEVPVAGQLRVQNLTYACLFAKCTACTIHFTPQPCEKPPRSGSAVLLDKNGPVCFSILQKIILVNIWILN